MKRQFSFLRLSLSLSLGLLLLAMMGCGGNRLETGYATTRGKSLNGISTFLQLLRSEGHRVESVPYLSPRIGEKGEFLVVFHDSPGPMDAESQKAIIELCQSPSIHSILVVLKNGDMNEEYFSALKKAGNLDAEQLKRIRESLDFLSDMKDLAKSGLKLEFPVEETGGYYGLKKVDRPKPEEPIKVDIFPPPPVDEDEPYIVPGTPTDRRPPENKKGPETPMAPPTPLETIPAQWRLERRLVPGKDAYVRWSSGQDPLLTQRILLETRLFVLASAVPLLNAGLADPGNRVLCEEIAGLFPPNSRVIVSTSSDWRPSRDDDEPDGGIMRFLRVQPYPWIFGQALLAIVLFCWWKYPILGRPRSENGEAVKRFGRHIDALGDLLRRTRDRSFILKRIREWQRVRNNLK